MISLSDFKDCLHLVKLIFHSNIILNLRYAWSLSIFELWVFVDKWPFFILEFYLLKIAAAHHIHNIVNLNFGKKSRLLLKPVLRILCLFSDRYLELEM